MAKDNDGRKKCPFCGQPNVDPYFHNCEEMK